MKRIRLATKIIKTLIKDRIHYPGRLVADTSAIIVRCGILLILYYYVFKLKGGSVNDTPFIIAAWSVFFYFAFSTLQLREISKAIMQDVQTGNVETLFTKPISYLRYRMWWQIGSGVYPFLVATALGSLALVLTVGIPETMSSGMFLGTLVVTVFTCTVLSLLLYSIVGLLAFWIEDINPVFWMVDKAVMILGGSYLPVALFPAFMYKLSLYSPFGSSQLITHTVYSTWQSNWYLLVSIQVFWIIALGIFLKILFAKATKKVSVNGG